MSQESATEENSSSSSPPLPEILSDSPLHSMPTDFRNALDEFRNNWQRELKTQIPADSTSITTPDTVTSTQQVDDPTEVETVTDEAVDILAPLASTNNNVVVVQDTAEPQMLAENLFRKAVELEQRGKVYDALPLYRKAIQLVPDIEFQYYEQQKLKTENVKPFNSQVTTPDDCSDGEELNEDLYDKFRADLLRDFGGRLLLNSRDPSVISTELHISDLPPEILFYILRWVVSNQLDMRSLEQCAAVCKGFYLCARDEELWRLACVKVWGYNVGTLLPANTPLTSAAALGCCPYYSWRQMFLERERVHFNGCYISKTTYLRMGENSFQDQFYRPVQLVEYYRYLRFLPDGTVFMMTNADEPLQGVAKLRNLQQLRPDVLRGHYRLFDNTVSIVVKKQMPKQQQQQQQQRIIGNSGRHRRGSSAITDEVNNINYCLEFRITSTPKRKFVQLSWLHYSIEQTRKGIETTTEFDLTLARYPPLWFSPVRSYHLDADTPLG